MSTDVLPLTPWLPPQQEAARAALVEALARWLAPGDGWTIEVRREHTAGTPTPTSIDLRGPGAVRLLLHREPKGWTLGRLGITVARDLDGVRPDASSASRALLRRWDAWFRETPDEGRRESGDEIAELHQTWARLASMEDRFYRHIEDAHNGRTGLIRVGFLCNQDCHFCWEGRDWPAAPDELVFQWLDELAGHGVGRLTICGGEPTLWRHLPAFIDRAHRTHGMQVHMNTNAIKLRQAAFTQRLLDAGLGSIMVSLHSVDPAVSDRMTRAPGTHVRTVEGLHTALSLGMTVILNCAIERDNLEGVPEHARWVRRELVERHPENPVRMVNYSQPGKYYDELRFAENLVAVDDARRVLGDAARTLHEVGVLLEITGTCGFPACVVSEVPEVAPWRELSTFDAFHLSARRHDPEPCQRCAVRAQCVGVRREYVDQHGERGLIPYESVPRSDWYERLAATQLSAGWSMGDG